MRTFEGVHAFLHFSEFLAEQILVQVEAEAVAAEWTAHVMKHNVQHVIGSSKLADLAASTQAERLSLGYSANDPLLRSGELLRDGVEDEAAGPIAAVGHPSPIMAYHEFGYLNARTGTAVPARPAFRIGAEESIPEALEIIGQATRYALEGKPRVDISLP